VAANVGIRRDGLDPDGKRFPLYSGSFHYCRHDTVPWPGILDAIKVMGFQTICTHIPPGACMSVRGETSTSGRTIPRCSDARVEAALPRSTARGAGESGRTCGRTDHDERHDGPKISWAAAISRDMAGQATCWILRPDVHRDTLSVGQAGGLLAMAIPTREPFRAYLLVRAACSVNAAPPRLSRPVAWKSTRMPWSSWRT
jgi:hypothetical protein